MTQSPAEMPQPLPDATESSSLSLGGLTEFLRPAAPADALELGPGARIGDITIVGLLGEGGMGRVYEAVQGMPCRTVAVKVIRPGLLSKAALRRFENEIHVLGRLEHPGIARIYSAGIQRRRDGDLPYLVMEYVEQARPVTQYATDHRLGTRDRVALFCEVCAAVAHGHSKGIVHRDLKPGNIVVDAHGRPKIIDFGIARSTDGDVALTAVHTDAAQLVGTLQYMSPEQFDGRSDEIDHRSDVYALGMVLYELLTGRPPYDLKSRPVYEAARVVRETEPPSLATSDVRLRGDIDTIVAKCLEKDRHRRYATAADVQLELGRYLRGEPIIARPPRLVESLARLARRHRFAAATAVGIAAALLLAVLGISGFAMHAERQRLVAVAERERADDARQEATRQLYVANMRSLQACLDNHNIRLARRLHADNAAIIGPAMPLELGILGASIDESLAVLDLEAGPINALAYAPDGTSLAAVAGPANLGGTWTPDGYMLQPRVEGVLTASLPTATAMTAITVFTVGAHSAYLPAALGDETWLRSWLKDRGMTHVRGLPLGEPEILAFTADGRLAVEHQKDGCVRVVGPQTAGAGVLLDGHKGRLRKLALSADGGRVAIIGPTGGLGLWDARTGKQIGLEPYEGAYVATQFSTDGTRLAAVVTVPQRATKVVLHDADGRLVAVLAQEQPDEGRLALAPRSMLVSFSADGSRIVTNDGHHAISAWSTADGSLRGSYVGQSAAVTALAYAPDGSTLASGAANGHVMLWDAETFEPQRTLLGQTTAVTALAFRPDGAELATGGLDSRIRVWSTRDPAWLASLGGVEGLTAVAFSPDGGTLAAAPANASRVELWSPHTVERRRTLDGGGRITALAFSHDGRLVATASTESDVRIWDVATGERLATLDGHGGGATGVSFSPDDSRVLTTSGELIATVWDWREARGMVRLQNEPAVRKNFPAAVFGAEGRSIAYIQPTIVDATTGAVVHRLRSRGQLTALAASGDGRTLAVGMPIGSLTLTDFASGKFISHNACHADAVRSIAFSVDGERLVSGSLDGTAQLHDARTGKPLRTFRGHEGSVETAILSPDSRRVVTASTDGTVRVWDADTGQEMCQVPGQSDVPQAVALSPDGRLLVTAPSGGTPRIWGLSNADVARARQDVSERR